MPGEPWCEDGRLKIEHISINPAGEDKITYCVRAQLAQPPPNVLPWSLDPGVNAAASKRYLETSVEREKAEGLTLDTFM